MRLRVVVSEEEKIHLMKNYDFLLCSSSTLTKTAHLSVKQVDEVILLSSKTNESVHQQETLIKELFLLMLRQKCLLN